MRDICITVLCCGLFVNAERPSGQSLFGAALQVDLRFDSRAHYLNGTTLQGNGMTESFEDLLCFALNGKKLYYRPRKSIMIALRTSCAIHYAGSVPVRTVQLDFEEGVVEDEDLPPTVVVKVQYGAHLQGVVGQVDSVAGNENAWVIGGHDGIAYQTWTEHSGQPFFFNEDFRTRPPPIWLCGVLVTSTKERLFGKKKATTETANFRNVEQAVSKKGQLWFATKLLPDKDFEERGIVIAGFQAENSAATAGLEDVERQHRVIQHTTRDRGRKTTLGKCGKTKNMASCLNAAYVCEITKIEYDADAHTVVLSFVSHGDGSDGYLRDGKDPTKSMLYWEGHGGSAKPSVKTSENNATGKIIGSMTFKNIPRDAKSVQFRYGSANCCNQHTQSYSKADIDLNNLPGLSQRNYQAKLFFFLFFLISGVM